MTNVIRNQGSDFGREQKCGGVKPVNGILTIFYCFICLLIIFFIFQWGLLGGFLSRR